jgi:ABC-2 type transport system ATP-binding protein
VPQRPAQYGHLSARENLVLFARLARLDDATAAVDALLVRFGLPSGGQPAAQLSVGNQQRLNLALGLLGEPEVLLLDEPAASLDPRHRRLLWEAVESVRRGGGAVAFATHVMEEADRHATRVVALLDGEVVFAGRPGDLAGAVPELVSP